MTTPTPPSPVNISLNSLAHVMVLRVAQPLVGSERMTLSTDDGRVKLEIPTALFGFLSHDDTALVTLSAWKVVVTSTGTPASSLILPEGIA